MCRARQGRRTRSSAALKDSSPRLGPLHGQVGGRAMRDGHLCRYAWNVLGCSRARRVADPPLRPRAEPALPRLHVPPDHPTILRKRPPDPPDTDEDLGLRGAGPRRLLAPRVLGYSRVLLVSNRRAYAGGVLPGVRRRGESIETGSAARSRRVRLRARRPIGATYEVDESTKTSSAGAPFRPSRSGSRRALSAIRWHRRPTRISPRAAARVADADPPEDEPLSTMR